MEEPTARLKIQKLIDKHNIKASILFNGNGVYSKKRILRNLRIIINKGKLYRDQTPKYFVVGPLILPPDTGKLILTKYFYEFLHLCCGSIAHHNIYGWVTCYPTLEDLKQFFKKNEYGKRVLDDIPWWHTDAKKIVQAIERQLFPFEHFKKKHAPFFGVRRNHSGCLIGNPPDG